jgi:hypothetical protein
MSIPQRPATSQLPSANESKRDGAEADLQGPDKTWKGRISPDDNRRTGCPYTVRSERCQLRSRRPQEPKKRAANDAS